MDKIELKPHMFKAYLKELGFKLLQTIEDKNGRVEKPLFVYKKWMCQPATNVNGKRQIGKGKSQIGAGKWIKSLIY